MRNISVPTNDTMIFAVHGNTVDECIADCAKLMAYLTNGAQPENTVDDYDSNDYNDYDDDDDYDSDDYDDYELTSFSNTVYRYHYCDGYDDGVPSDEVYSNKHDCINAAYEELKNSRVYKEHYQDYVHDCLVDDETPDSFKNWFYDLEDSDLFYIEECRIK